MLRLRRPRNRLAYGGVPEAHHCGTISNTHMRRAGRKVACIRHIDHADGLRSRREGAIPQLPVSPMAPAIHESRSHPGAAVAMSNLNVHREIAAGTAARELALVAAC